jgi:hypothetical protein
MLGTCTSVLITAIVHEVRGSSGRLVVAVAGLGVA